MRQLTLHPLLCVAILCGVCACRSSIDTPSEDEEPSWELDPGVMSSDPDPTPSTPTMTDPAAPMVASPVEPIPDPVEPIDLDTLLGCEVERLLWDEQPAHRFSPAYFGWAPGGEVLVNSDPSYNSWNMRRARDGEVMSIAYVQHMRVDVSDDWSKELRLNNDSHKFELVHRDTEELLWSSPAFENSVAYATMNDDGSRTGLYTCSQLENGEHVAEMSLWNTRTRQRLAHHEFEVQECEWWTQFHGAFLEISPDGDTLVTAHTRFSLSEEGGQVVGVHPMVSVLNDAFTQIELGDVQPEEQRGIYYGYLSLLKFDPMTAHVHVVTSDGNHHTVDPETGMATRKEPRGAFISNWDTYLPGLPTSALAWHEGTSIRASVNMDGMVEIHSLDGQGEPGDLIHTIEAPEVDENLRRSWPQEVPNAPTSIAFSEGGDMVMVGFTRGLGVWGCRGTLPVGEDSLSDLEVQIPSRFASGITQSFEVDYQQRASTFITTVKVYIDGRLHQSFDAARDELSLTIYGHDTFSVEIEVDDGLDVVRSAPIEVVVFRDQ